MRTSSQVKKMKPVNIDNSGFNNFIGFEEMDSTLTNYLTEVRHTKVLSRENEIKIVERIKSGDEKAFDEFVKSNMRIVVSVAKHYQYNGVSPLDLIQYGNIGLIKAARNYVEGTQYKNVKFMSYCIWLIRKEISDAVEREGSIVRRTHNMNITALKVKKSMDEFESRYGYKPDAFELSQMTNESINDIREVMGNDNTSLSIDEQVDDDDNNAGAQSYSDTLVGHQTADGDLMKDDMRKRLNMMMKILDKRESEILRMLFGIGYDYEYPIDRIAEEYKTTAENIRIIKNKALKKLKLNFKQY